ncbi:MAG TPA: iron ABC transporter permease, partial [Herpetosiphonaceae bacterium]
GFSSVASALISVMITFGNIDDVQRALVWLTGSVYGSTWSEVWALLPWVVGCVPLAVLLARDLNALSLGEEVARGLGSTVGMRRGLLLVTAVALVATSVAVAGTISFVGLMAPHLARRLVGSDQSGLLPTAGILGTLIVVLADLVGRTIFAPIELPCGLVTAAIGAPCFFLLLYQQRYK